MSTRHGSRRILVRLATLAGAAVLVMAVPGPALAVPDNDDITTPRVVDALPYADGPYDTTTATTGATDPGFCYEPEAGPDAATVWYAFTPVDDGFLVADTFGSDYDTTLYVGTPAEGGGIDVIDCNDDAVDLQSAVTWEAVAGTTYLLVIGSCCGGGGGAGGGGMLEVHVDVAPPPPSIDLWIAPTGTFSPYGIATVHGTVTCENAGSGSVELAASQRVGRFVIRGWGWVEEIACDGTPQPWTADVWSEDGKFLGGRLMVEAWAGACGSFSCADAMETLRISLRR